MFLCILMDSVGYIYTYLLQNTACRALLQFVRSDTVLRCVFDLSIGVLPYILACQQGSLR